MLYQVSTVVTLWQLHTVDVMSYEPQCLARCSVIFMGNYRDVTWAPWHLKSPATRLYIRLLAEVNNTESDRSPHPWHLWGETTGGAMYNQRACLYLCSQHSANWWSNNTCCEGICRLSDNTVCFVFMHGTGNRMTNFRGAARFREISSPILNDVIRSTKICNYW